MPKGYIQLGASCSSPSICPARATGCRGDHPLHVKPSFKAQKYISQLKVYKIDNFKLVHNHSNKGGLVCFMIKVNFQRTMNAD